MQETPKVGRTVGCNRGVSNLFIKGEVSLEPFLFIFKKTFLYSKTGGDEKEGVVCLLEFLPVGHALSSVMCVCLSGFYMI
jgi:hypothetical protein